MRRWLDRVTGRVTMYRLVTLLLTAIAILALLLSLIGEIPFTPVELLASLAAAVGSTVVTNRLFAVILRTTPHLESSIITGLILFFLFRPTLLLPGLATLAIAGALATASKYLIAWRGRHILNPAAAGAALVALLPLGSAVWWVATSALLPLTLLGAFLVLFRTRRLSMGIVFVAVSAAILTVRLASNGQDVLDAISTTFASYPVLFFVGFMLSEPLTLPPRRWQQWVLAAIVGVLFTIPWSLGPVFLSFEFALILGNVLAFLLGQRRALRLIYLGKRQLTPTAWEFSFQPQRPVAFRPGQYMELTIPHAGQDARGSRRYFSIASAPAADAPVRFGMRMSDRSSSFKRAILDLEPGTAVRATSVGGDFLLPRNSGIPLLLIAGGIGITPMLSQLAHHSSTGQRRDAIVLYRVSSLQELAYTDELAGEGVLLVAPEAPRELPANWRWVGAGPITSELLAREVPDAAARAAFVSGSPAFVSEARAALRRLGAKRVATDYFTGY